MCYDNTCWFCMMIDERENDKSDELHERERCQWAADWLYKRAKIEFITSETE